jgi:uracil-DNA glycosylase family 4
MGEAPGFDEVRAGRPFVGAAGGMLQRLLTLLGWDRAAQRIGNVNQCAPPKLWLDGAPWQYGSIQHCAVHRRPLLDEGHPVVIALGTIALRTLLDLQGKKVRINDFHGAILRDPTDAYWVVPTFHPSHLQRGAHNLIGTVLWDLEQAARAVTGGKPPDESSIVVDPPLEWFRAWVDTAVAARTQDPDAYPISSDVETPDKASGKDEGEITAEDQSYEILRVNVAINPDEGVTVPFVGPFIDELRRLHQSPGPIWGFNYEYDFPRLCRVAILAESDHRRVTDLMWLWHYLQSDLPRGLGFVAPFYSSFGPWKHLVDSDPARYGSIDALQNHRVGFGVISDLIKVGQWEGAKRHIQQLHTLVLRPAQLVGVPIDRERLLTFKTELTRHSERLLRAIQTCVPEELAPLTPKQGLTAPPAVPLHPKATTTTQKGTLRKGKVASEDKRALYATARLVERLVFREVLVCTSCGEVEVVRKHRCRVAYTKKDGTIGWKPSEHPADVHLEVATVSRWFWQEPFNPDSPQQVLAYIRHRKHIPGKAKHTHEDTTNRETLEKLQKTGDPFYTHLLDYRAVVKVKGTYVEGTERRLDAENRLHPEPTFKPSTHRLSYQNPNITNVVSDRRGPDTLASGFRRCVVAAVGCRLLEVDFSAIEAVEVGWYCRDPGYLRLARLGVHAGLASHVLERPYDPRWSDGDIAAYFAEIKDHHRDVYEPAKRYVHGRSYGLTIPGMVLQFPDLFKTQKIAERYARIFEQMAPAVPTWQRQTQDRAAKQHYLGGPGDHPFGYKHWFWSVYTYKRIDAAQYYRLLVKYKDDPNPPVTVLNGTYFRVSLGEDGKRAIAFYPQSTAAGVLKEVMLRLFDPESPAYIGDAYYGKTPLRAPIHDSLLLEVPDRAWDRVYETVCTEMRRPIPEQPLPVEWAMGSHLSIGVAAKAGRDWMSMEKLTLPAVETIWQPAEEDDTDDGLDLARVLPPPEPEPETIRMPSTY